MPVIARRGPAFVAENGPHRPVRSIRSILSIFDTARTSHLADVPGGDVSRVLEHGRLFRTAGFFAAAIGRGSIALQKHWRLTFRSLSRGLGTDIQEGRG